MLKINHYLDYIDYPHNIKYIDYNKCKYIDCISHHNNYKCICNNNYVNNKHSLCDECFDNSKKLLKKLLSINVKTSQNTPTSSNVKTSENTPTSSNVKTSENTPTSSNVKTSENTPTLPNVKTSANAPTLPNVTNSSNAPTSKIKLTKELKEKYYKLKENFYDNCKNMELLLDFASDDEIKLKCELNQLKELIDQSFDDDEEEEDLSNHNINLEKSYYDLCFNNIEKKESEQDVNLKRKYLQENKSQTMRYDFSSNELYNFVEIDNV